MILLYTLAVLLLGVAAFLVRYRVRGLERKYYRVATEADRLAKDLPYRQGNTGRPDPYQTARRHYELGRLVQKRDRLEARFDWWQKAAKRLGNYQAAIRAWKGRKLPYTFGVVDVALVMYLIDEFTVGQYASVKQLAQAVAALIGK
jgi:hypothetical protein